jgi:hypothetical protein
MRWAPGSIRHNLDCMSNAKTGIWSALGALLGGVAGATTAKYVVAARPRYRYSYNEQRPRRSPSGVEIEDAMVVGGAAGAMLGAFVAGTVAGEDAPAPTTVPQLTR